MSDISIPGITEGKYKTDKIVAGLVKIEEIKLEQMQEDRERFELKRDVWQSINILTNRLETVSRTLYNTESPFRQKFSLSSNKDVLQVENTLHAENGKYIVRVLQLAQADNLRSDELPRDFEVPSGNYTFGAGEENRSFEFRGGSLKQFVVAAKRKMHGLVQFDLLNSGSNSSILVLRSLESGTENRLRFADEGKKLALDIGLIIDAESLRLNLLQEKMILPFNELQDYRLTENELRIKPGQELSIRLGKGYTVRPGSVMRYEIRAPQEEPKLPPISDTPDNKTSEKENVPEEQKTQGADAPRTSPIKLQNARGSSREAAAQIPLPPGAELDNIRIESAGSQDAFRGLEPEDTKGEPGDQPENLQNPSQDSQVSDKTLPAKSNTPQKSDASNFDLLNPTANFYLSAQGRRVAAGQKQGEVQASREFHEEILSLSSGINGGLRSIDEVIIRNPNPDRDILVRDLRFEDTRIQDDYFPANPISEAQNAKISYLGVPVERPSNEIDDLLPGLNLELRQESPNEEILIRTQPDYDAIVERVVEFINAYNDLVTQLNVVGTGNEEIIREKTSFTDKQKAEALKVLGLMRGESNIRNFKNQLDKRISAGYPTELGIRGFSKYIGISTNLKGYRQGGVDRSKLRGYLEMDTEIFRKAVEENFEMVKNIFGRDNDGDFIIDSGVALELQKIGNYYTRSGGMIPYQVQNLKQNLDENEKQISEYKDYLKDYEADLRVKYGQMEGALNQFEQQKQSLQNFNNSMNGGR